MSRQLILMPATRPQGRWAEAFEDLREVRTPAEAVLAAAPNSIVWVDVQERGWLMQLRARRPDLLLVALSLNPGVAEGMLAFEAGARGYCHALAAPEMLRQVATVVGNGGLWLGAELMARAASAVAKLTAPDASVTNNPLDRLTPRERDVALQVAGGAANKEIAQRLAITPRTVKAHMTAILDKLDARDRLQLVLILRRAGAIPELR